MNDGQRAEAINRLRYHCLAIQKSNQVKLGNELDFFLAWPARKARSGWPDSRARHLRLNSSSTRSEANFLKASGLGIAIRFIGVPQS
jgi:hypothetical protein